MKASRIDPIQLEIIWTRLVAIVDEAAAALVRTSFSAMIRDANDYGCALFDADYNLLAQSTFGTPGFLGALPLAVKAVGREFPPEMLEPGDIIVGNDPWTFTGHLNDVSLVCPIFLDGRLIAYASCTAHQMDIGGRIAAGETREIYEEGLFIPTMKLFEAARENETVFKFIRSNVRLADYVIGDIRAQITALDVMADRLNGLLKEYGVADLEGISKEILGRTESAVRANISKFKEGTYRSCTLIDKLDGDPIQIAVAVTLKDGQVTIDYDGSSAQISKGVNVCYNYTRSYTTLAVKCALSPALRHNEGGLRPITVLAPEGSILNVRYPAAVHARNNIGQFLPEIVFSALSFLIPDRVIAGSGSAPLSLVRFVGQRSDGRQFLMHAGFRGGLGARVDADGVSTIAFPGNTVATPIEIGEGDGPIVYEKREFLRDSAGAGRFRGGYGQHVVMRVATGAHAPAREVITSIKAGRIHYPVPGLMGGGDAPTGSVAVNGEPIGVSGKQVLLGPGDCVELCITGGGGYGDPRTRDIALIEEDIRNGLLSPGVANELYGIGDLSGKIDTPVE